MAIADPAPETLAEKLGGTHVSARNDLEISRHVFFGETSYVVRDPITFEGRNFSPEDYEVFTNLCDSRPLSEIFEDLVQRGVTSVDDEEGFYRFVIELQKQSLLSLPLTDGESLYNQYVQRKKSGSKNLLMKLLFLKVPLGSPDRFLRANYHLVQNLFSRPFFFIWLAGLLAASILVGLNWREFTSDLSSLLAIQNLPMILIVMSLLKLWHELGHGFACRHFGVSVPNAGLLFMIGTPLAFMDATGSWSLPSRTRRQIINLAGIYFEMMITIIAAFVWVFVDHAFIKSIAHFTLIVSSVTTIGFNINPLMKYDGYFVLADSLGIPNLKSRASASIQSLAKCIFFRIPLPPCKSRSLRMTLMTYGVAAACYRITLVIAISAMIATQLWVIGLLIGGYFLISSFGSMGLNIARYLLWSEEAQQQRVLAYTYLCLLILVPMAILLACPVPGRAQARGVVEPGTLCVVHMEEGGFLRSIDVESGQPVDKGTLLTSVENLEIDAKRSNQQAKIKSLQVKYRKLRGDDLVEAGKTEQEIEQLKYELSHARSNSPVVQIKSAMQGRVISSLDQRALGQYLEPGQELMRIGDESWVIRAVADANSLADIKPQIGQTVHCRFLANPEQVFEGTLEHVSASGSRIVTHKALTHLAGGFIPVDGETMEATEPFFDLLIRLDDHPDVDFLKNGHVCEIRFSKTYQTIGSHAYRGWLRFINKINTNQ